MAQGLCRTAISGVIAETPSHVPSNAHTHCLTLWRMMLCCFKRSSAIALDFNCPPPSVALGTRNWGCSCATTPPALIA